MGLLEELKLVGAEIIKVEGNRIVASKNNTIIEIKASEIDGVVMPDDSLDKLMRLVDELCSHLETHGLKIEACPSKLLTWIFEQWKG